MSTAHPLPIAEPLWLRDYARYRRNRWGVPMANTFAEYQAAAQHKRLDMHRLWHDIEKHRTTQTLSRKEITFELRTARRQGAAADRIRDLELLLHERDKGKDGSR